MRILRLPLIWVTLAIAVMLVLAGVINSQRAQLTAGSIEGANEAEQGQPKHESTNRFDALKRKPKAKEYEADCTDRKDADLCAQRRMAEEAGIQTRLNELGLWLLGFTFLATGVAAFYARQAAIAAGSTVGHMHDTANRQLRAYVGTRKAEIETFEVGKGPRASVYIKNFGQTPAYDVCTGTAVVLGTWDAEGRHLRPKAWREWRTLNPGDEIMISAYREDITLTEIEVDDVAEGTRYIFVAGVITYRDAFNEPRKSNFRFAYGGMHGVKIGRLAICPEGNDAD